jgi:hypothetical protein
VYQRTLLGTGQDPPVTATAPPDEELTPLDGCRLADELDDDDVDEVDDEVADGFAACAVDVDVPGMVAALTAAKIPTPASEPAAAPTVRRWSNRRAASRERTLAWVALVVGMGLSLPDGAKSYLGGG